MQQDMHFYAVYALARAAGIVDEVAETIAYASQFVDDAIDQGVVLVSDKDAVVPTMTSHKPIDYQNAIPNNQWHVWVPFHFLPGNTGTDFYSRMTCEKGSDLAKKMLGNTITDENKEYWPHLIGIAAHVFADTFSHYGFIGLCSNNNRVIADSISPDETIHSAGIVNYLRAKLDEFTTRFEGGVAETVPIGHGAVGTFPDRPFLKWKFKYENSPTVTERNNPSDYLNACQLLHDHFVKYSKADKASSDPKGAKVWATFSQDVEKILTAEGPMDVRIYAWKEALSISKFSDATSNDKCINYNEDLWRPRRISYSLANGNLKDSDTCRFIRAANRHRNYVLQELLPETGLITF